MCDAYVVDWPHLTHARIRDEQVRVELVTDDASTAVITGETVVSPFVTAGTGGRRLGVHAGEGAAFTLSPAVCRWEWDGEITHGPIERSARPQSLVVSTGKSDDPS
jgi:hypothetical protein